MQHWHLRAVRLGAVLPHQKQSADHQPGGTRRTGEGDAFRSQSTLTPDHHQGWARKPSAGYWSCIRENAMSTNLNAIRDLAEREYKWGFVTSVEEERVPKGLNEDIIRLISAKKNEPAFMLQWRLKAYHHWASLEKAQAEPKWANVKYGPIDYQEIVYYSAPKQKPGLTSLEELDPEILRTYEKLGIPLEEQKHLAGVAVDAVFDSVSVATTFKEKLAELGIIFCSFSEAVQKHPELVQKYLGSVVPYTDNFFAALNAAVFTDGSFVYVPKGVRCPMELSTYFRINAADSGQFERTLIIADEGSYVSYLEGCTAPTRDKNQLHAAVVELVAHDNAEGEFYSVALSNHWQQADTGTKMIHIGKNTRSTIIAKGISAGHGQNTYRGGVKVLKGAVGARNYTQCDSLLVGDKCGAHTFPYIEAKNSTARIEHEASTSKVGDDQIFYLQQRGLPKEDALSMIINGFCKQVFRKLPMEFAVEAQKLLSVSLEESVG